MKNVLFATMLISSMIFAQEAKIIPKTPVNGNYEDVLIYFDEWSKNVGNPEFYEKLNFTLEQQPPKKPKLIKFTELSDFDKSMFYLKQAEKISNHLFKFEIIWDKEHTALDLLSEKEQLSIAEKYLKLPATQRPSMSKDVKLYLNNLLSIRKAHAVRYEQLITKIFKEHKTKLPSKDRSTYVRKVKAWNDKHHLVDRNRKPK